MITTTHPNNRYSISKFNKNFSVNSNSSINFPSGTGNLFTFKIFPKPGEIVLAGNFKVGFTNSLFRTSSTGFGSDMVHVGEGIGLNAPHGSINYLEDVCKTKYKFRNWIQPTANTTNPQIGSFSTQIHELTIEEVYSTTSNFPIYLRVEVSLNFGVTLLLFNSFNPSLSIDLDFDLMQ